METYPLKSIACLFILWGFYKLLLENLSYHHIKRAFLLLAVVSSLIIPGLVFTEYVPVTTQAFTTMGTQTATVPLEAVPASLPVTDMDTINWNLVLLTVYLFGVLVFGFRFLRNLAQIAGRVRSNAKIKAPYGTQVLLQQLLPPHTFFSYVFLNKKQFEENKIPKEVLLHEAVHARQLHSLDVVFVELVQVVFWFNPMVYVIKHAIKLNHEFLADSAVIKKTQTPTTYQNTLLSYLSQESAYKYQSIKMANAITYSSIKKRFKIMKTETSKKAVLLRSILVLPLFALLLFAFSTTKEVLEPRSTVNLVSLDHTARSIEITILKDGSYLVEGMKVNTDNLVQIVNTLHTDITPETRKKIINIHLKSNREVTREEVWFFYNSLMDYGFHRLVTAEQEVNLSKGNTPLAIENGKSAIVDLSKQKNMQKRASHEQIKEYNALAKKYNEMDRSNMRIQVRDVERLEYIYSIMTDEQKAAAEPFPDFPEPPVPPATPTANEITPIKFTATNKAKSPPASQTFRSPPEVHQAKPTKSGDTTIQKIIAEQDPYDVVNGNLSIDPSKAPVYKNLKKTAQPQNPKGPKGEASAAPPAPSQTKSSVVKDKAKAVPAPPAPPKPNPLDHIIEMAKKDATFYYKRKEISADDAIALLKKNPDLSISTKQKNNERPVVKISKNL